MALQLKVGWLLAEENYIMMFIQDQNSSGSSSRVKDDILEAEDTPVPSKEQDSSRRMEMEEELS